MKINTDHYIEVFKAREALGLNTNHQIYYPKHTWIGETFQHPIKDKIMTVEKIYKMWYWGWGWFVLAADDKRSHDNYAIKNISMDSASFNWYPNICQELRDKKGDIEVCKYPDPNTQEAMKYFLSGNKFSCSTGIHDGPTFGYGELDNAGFFEFDLPPQEVDRRPWEQV